MRLHRCTTALLCALSLAAGCTSFEQLERNDPNVDEQEVFAAGRSGSPEHLGNLHHVLANRGAYDPEVVAAALTSVAEIGDPSSVPHVAALADDSDEEIRWHVASTLKQLGGREADAVLEDMAAHDPSELVRSEATR